MVKKKTYIQRQNVGGLLSRAEGKNAAQNAILHSFKYIFNNYSEMINMQDKPLAI